MEGGRTSLRFLSVGSDGPQGVLVVVGTLPALLSTEKSNGLMVNYIIYDLSQHY